MAKHRSGSAASRWLWPAVAVLAGCALAVAAALVVFRDSPSDPADSVGGSACDRPVKVVTATSFAPVLDAVAPALDHGPDCVRLDITTSDGRAAVRRVAEVNADVWIPDDGAWVGSAGSLSLAPAPTAGAGTVLAASPLYMVSDRATGTQLQKAGNSWRGLTQLVDESNGLRLTMRDPASSGDGMVAAGALAEAVWLEKDMDASALWLADALKRTRTVTDGTPALPTRNGEVGIVPEYALLPTLSTAGDSFNAMPGTDQTAMLRYTWYPLATALRNKTRAAGLDRLLRELTGPAAAAYLRTANLRTPAGAHPPNGGSGGGGLPAPQAKPLGLLAAHHVDHVFATWYAEDRRTNLLVVVDVSGSMGKRAGGSTASRIDLVREGCRSVGVLLPDESRMGLWEFGSQLDGDRDYRSLLGIARLSAGHRKALAGAVDKLQAQDTGTGLYDTILAAYTSARQAYRRGVPNQVLVFTDGHNEGDTNSISATELADGLKKAADPQRPILLSVITFGTKADAKAVNDAVTPVQGYVDNLATAKDVSAVFIHVAAGGLHH
jgi:Bacterial extracellular solute-binding protein/von Willebrand factor type A domain